MANIMIISGPNFMPAVSSSKKRNRPALAAGMGASWRLFFSRPLKLKTTPIQAGFGAF